MKRLSVRLLLILLFLVFIPASAVRAQIVQYAFRVSFNNKNNSVYSLNNPAAYLSTRAIDRRVKYNIGIDSLDLPVQKLYIDSVLKLTQGKLHVTSRWFNQCVVLLADSTKILQLNGKSFVSGFKLVAAYETALHIPKRKDSVTTFNGQRKTTDWGSAYYGSSWTQTELLHGDTLHNMGLRGKGVLIAIMDEGFAGTDTHPGFDSIRNTGRIVNVHNFVKATNAVYDIYYHGTEVLSTIAGNLPNSYIGAAPGASFALYSTEDYNSEQPIEMDNMIAATEWADSLGADIVQTSVGYDTFGSLPGNDFGPQDRDGKTIQSSVAANIATRKGILFVCSAGNEGFSPTVQNTLLTPGDADSAFTIGNVNGAKYISGTSSMGPNYANVVKPDVCAMGDPTFLFRNNGIGTDGGTSFAAPQIAGWAACLMESAPNATPYQIKQCIRLSADGYAFPQKQRGYGVPDFRTAYKILHGTVIIDTPPVEFVQVFPTIFNDNVTLVVNSSTDQTISFCLYDISGKVIWKMGPQAYGTGYSLEHIYFSKALATGMYFFKAVGAQKSQVTRLIRY